MFKHRRGGIFVDLTEDEADLLRGVIRQYLELLETEPQPGDPVVARLFPDASLDDRQISKEFREMAGSDLMDHKLSTARSALESLDDEGPWEDQITAELGESWLVLLTDLRLAIGVRLGVTEETMSQAVDPHDPSQMPIAVLHWLGGLQESLVEASSKSNRF